MHTACMIVFFTVPVVRYDSLLGIKYIMIQRVVPSTTRRCEPYWPHVCPRAHWRSATRTWRPSPLPSSRQLMPMRVDSSPLRRWSKSLRSTQMLLTLSRSGEWGSKRTERLFTCKCYIWLDRWWPGAGGYLLSVEHFSRMSTIVFSI